VIAINPLLREITMLSGQPKQINRDASSSQHGDHERSGFVAPLYGSIQLRRDWL
jgi:hypothetical protein